jgi:ABC-2 type transport system ATP-binding protein
MKQPLVVGGPLGVARLNGNGVRHPTRPLPSPAALTVAADVPEPAIVVRGLGKSYGATEVLRGIDFEVHANEVFGFLGPNGAGKTTTIEILEGYRERSAGDVVVLGADPGHPSRAWRRRIGLVLQECELDPLLTVRETLSLFSSFYPSPRPVDETVALVGLAGERNARVRTLSGGQKRRLDVAVALVGDPELLFLDEPTTGFDPSARRSAWNMIEGLRSLGKTIFLTTHYMDEAQHLSDRVAILRGGRIVAIGSPDELAEGGGDQTVISFRLPPGVGIDALRADVGGQLDISGALVSLRAADAQRALYELTSWAERERVELAGLEARRPGLEDVFLELTGDGHD